MYDLNETMNGEDFQCIYYSFTKRAKKNYFGEFKSTWEMGGERFLELCESKFISSEGADQEKEDIERRIPQERSGLG